MNVPVAAITAKAANKRPFQATATQIAPGFVRRWSSAPMLSPVPITDGANVIIPMSLRSNAASLPGQARPAKAPLIVIFNATVAIAAIMNDQTSIFLRFGDSR